MTYCRPTTCRFAVLLALALAAFAFAFATAGPVGSAFGACPPGNNDPSYCTGSPTAVINVPRDGGRYSTTVAPYSDFACYRGQNPLFGYGPLDPPSISSPIGAGTACNATLPNATALYTVPHAPVTNPPGLSFTVTAKDTLGQTDTATSTYAVMPFQDIISGDSPTGYFRLNDNNGSGVMDNSSSGFPDGEYKNNTQSHPVGISGDGDRARRFSGDSGYGYINGLSVPSFGWTMEAWVYLPDVDFPAAPTIVRDGTIMEHGRGGGLYVKNGLFTARNGDDFAVAVPSVLDGSVKPWDNTWYHVVARWDGFNIAIFVNRSPGVGSPKSFYAGSRGSTPSSYRPGGSPTFYLGYGNQGGVSWLNGVIDEAGYFPTSLSTARISDHFYADPVPPSASIPSAAGAAGTAPGFTADSSNPASAPAKVSAALVKARARVTGLTSQLKAATKTLNALKRAHARRKVIALSQQQVTRLEAAIKKASSQVRSLNRQLAKARAQVKALQQAEAKRQAAAKKKAAQKPKAKTPR